MVLIPKELLTGVSKVDVPGLCEIYPVKTKLPEAMVTMADIAKRAGVSRATASIVLNNRQVEMRISDETRQRVLDAVQELGYRRNDLARAVGSGKNYVLGFVKMGSGEQETHLLEGVLKAAAEADYLLKVLIWGDAPVAEMARRCVEHRLAGLVTRSFPEAQDTIAFFAELESYGIPVVYVDDNLDHLGMPGMSCVTSDDEQGYRLTSRAPRRTGPPRHRLHRRELRPPSRPPPQEKLSPPDGRARPARARRLRARLRLGSHSDGAHDTATVSDPSRRPTALICAGDEPAAVAMRTLGRLGLRVPEDVSVIGYSDFSFAALLDPPLTTISQPFEEMGAVAARILLKRLQDRTHVEEVASRVALPTKLIVRESTAVIRA